MVTKTIYDKDLCPNHESSYLGLSSVNCLNISSSRLLNRNIVDEVEEIFFFFLNFYFIISVCHRR